MQIVIEIPEDIYNEWCNMILPSNKVVASTHVIIKDGIPLPKGHGRLIDANELNYTYVEELELKGQMHCVVRSLEIKEAPTILEADSISLRYKEYGEQLAEGAKEVLEDRGEEE